MRMNNEPIFIDKLPAATCWSKYNPNDITIPELNEWCLWSIIILGEREYFLGYLSEYNHTLYVRPDETRSYEINNTLYWARMNKLIFENEQIQTN